jgi:undecaprenyl-diphosphatase
MGGERTFVGSASDILKAIVLGAVQGLTEFLPISSSAHLIFVPWLFGWQPFGLAFDVALHLGTLSAVLIYFQRDLREIALGTLRGLPHLARGRMPDDPMGRIGIFIGFGTIPAAIVGLLANDALDEYFHQEPISDTVIAISATVLIVMGILLGAADRYGQRASVSHRPFSSITLRDALIVGCAQAFALLPGVSRSGSTITAGLFAGLSRPVAARFSFLLGVPIILAAGTVEMIDLAREGIPPNERGVFIAGVLTAAIVGYLTIAGLMRFLQQRTVDVFVIYRVVIGVTLLGLVAAGVR